MHASLLAMYFERPHIIATATEMGNLRRRQLQKHRKVETLAKKTLALESQARRKAGARHNAPTHQVHSALSPPQTPHT